MEPWKLYVMVGVMVVVDVVVLGVWQGVDPLQRTLEVFPLEVPKNTKEDIKVMPELEHCESRHNTIWLGECVCVCVCMCVDFNVNIKSLLSL